MKIIKIRELYKRTNYDVIMFIHKSHGQLIDAIFVQQTAQ